MHFFKRAIDTTFKKISIFVLFFMLLTVSAFIFYVIPRVEKQMIDEREYVLHEMTTFLHEVLAEMQHKTDADIIDTAQAHRMAKIFVQNFRYGKDGQDYFWITEIDTGTMLAHPNEELIGTDLEDLVDEDGFHLGKAMLDAVHSGTDSHVQYKWPSKSDSATNVTKLSYVTEFEPWGWLIGTGIYIDDVKEEISGLMMKIMFVIFLILFLLSAVLAWILRIGARFEKQKNIVEREFATFTQHLPIGIFRICISHNEPPQLWNQELLNLLEIPDEKIIKENSLNLLRFIKNHDEESKLRELLMRKKSIIGEEYEITTFANNDLWVKLYGTLSQKNEKYYFDASIENITEKKKTQEILEMSFVELKKTDQMKDEIISVTSHELRTPLTIVKGFASILHKETFGRLNEKQKYYTKKILVNTEKLLELITNMLDLEKIKAGKMETNLETINLNKMISDIYNDFEIRCLENGKSISISFDEEDYLVEADADHLKRIFVNLIDNAVKFTKKNSGIIAIFTKRVTKSKIEIHIKDNGCGIPEKDMPDLFVRFKQVGSNVERSTIGSGLGLPIVKNLVEHIGGKISVISNENEGSDFIITLNTTNK